MKERAWGVMLMFMLLLSFFLQQASAGFTSAGAASVSTADSEELTSVSASFAASRSEGTAAAFEHRTSDTLSKVQPRFTDPEAATATDQSTFRVTTESWTMNIRSEMSSELLNPNPDITINTVTEWENPSTVKNITDAILISTDEQQTASDFRTEQHLTLADHNEQDEFTTDMNITESISQADSTYMSTTVNRAGLRTLLSVIFSNMTLYTEGSRAIKTAPAAFTEQVGRTLGYTGNLMSTEAYQNKVTNDYTSSTQKEASGDSYASQITQSQSRLPTSRESEVEFTPETVHSSKPPLVTVMNFVGETDTLTNSTNSEVSYTSFVLPKDNRTSLSHQETETTDISLISVSKTMHEETKAPVMETSTIDLTTASSELWDVTTNKEESSTRFISTHVSFVSTHSPVVSQTTHPTVLTEVLSTISGQVTQKPHVTEKDRTVLVTVTTISSSSSNTVAPFTTTNVQSSTTAETHLSTSTKPATETISRTTTTITIPSQPTSGPTQPSLSLSSLQNGVVTTAVTTPHLETSTTSTSNNTTQTTQERRTTGSYIKSTSTMSTRVVTTEKYTNTEVTTTQRPVKSTLMPGHICESQPCANGGRCVLTTDSYRCKCLPSWSGNTCTDDVDECVNSPCPPASECVNTRGSFSCECPLGYDLHDGHTCTQVRTFLGTFSVNSSVKLRNNNFHELHREILHLLNSSLSILPGYRRSSLQDQDGLHIKVVNMFAMNANMTSTDIHNLIQTSLRNCTKSHCPLRYQLAYLENRLCLMQKNRCDTQYSVCNDISGIPFCQCLDGYFKKNPEDTTCRDCGDGFKLVNGTCVKCAFGFGGFNCNNFYGLIAMVVSPAAGGLLIIVIIALIVTCCRKDKNDINKIIFKSGELQMAPYSEFPKNSRVSMEWGRETIEMQENGSTKNLLQMTDIYYSPVLRNADVERNGLYPFSGLPGSRHSCIYPAQWNPSFICDDTRRRDYF